MCGQNPKQNSFFVFSFESISSMKKKKIVTKVYILVLENLTPVLYLGNTLLENKYLLLVIYKKMIILGAIAKFRIFHFPKSSIPNLKLWFLEH